MKLGGERFGGKMVEKHVGRLQFWEIRFSRVDHSRQQENNG